MASATRGGTKQAKKILLVDDAAVVRRVLGSAFEDAGYSICAEAENGVDAIDKAERCHPDLIVLDLAMPVMNGLQAASQIKRRMPGIPIILFTLYSAKELEKDARRAGVSCVISKSEPLDNLLVQAKSYLNHC